MQGMRIFWGNYLDSTICGVCVCERERERGTESQCVCVCLLTERYLWLEHLDLKLFQFPVVHHFRTKCELGVSMRSSRLETRVH